MRTLVNALKAELEVALDWEKMLPDFLKNYAQSEGLVNDSHWCGIGSFRAYLSCLKKENSFSNLHVDQLMPIAIQLGNQESRAIAGQNFSLFEALLYVALNEWLDLSPERGLVDFRVWLYMYAIRDYHLPPVLIEKALSVVSVGSTNLWFGKYYIASHHHFFNQNNLATDEGVCEFLQAFKALSARENFFDYEFPCDCSVLNQFVTNDVNIVGYFSAPSGVGEDARSTRLAFGLFYDCVSSFDVSATTPIAERYIINRGALKPSNIEIFNLPLHQVPRARMQAGYTRGKESYSIGYCPWELTTYPDSALHIFDEVNELWAATKFIYDTWLKYTQKPVVLMPLPVVLPEAIPDFNGPLLNTRFFEENFVFLFTYDGISYGARKNPEAVVNAFLKAFGRANNLKVKLLIKVINANDDTPFYSALVALTKQSSDIIVINERFSHIELLSLIQSSSAYVSLHRSEGFGRGMAEAMFLGTPVICTSYSGNVDFCNANTAYLVDYELVPVSKSDYIHSEGAFWAEPNVEMAAAAMLEVLKDEDLRKSKINQGRALVEDLYSVEACAKRYNARISTIRTSQNRRLSAPDQAPAVDGERFKTFF